MLKLEKDTWSQSNVWSIFDQKGNTANLAQRIKYISRSFWLLIKIYLARIIGQFTSNSSCAGKTTNYMAEKGLVNRNMASLGIFIGILRKLEILKKTVCKKQGKFSLPCSLSLEFKSPCTKKVKHLNTSVRKLFLKNSIRN